MMFEHVEGNFKVYCRQRGQFQKLLHMFYYNSFSKMEYEYAFQCACVLNDYTFRKARENGTMTYVLEFILSIKPELRNNTSSTHEIYMSYIRR